MFDLIAEIINCLLEIDITRLLEDFSCISETQRTNCLEKIFGVVVRSPEHKYTKNEIIDVEYIKEIRKFYIKCKKNKEYMTMLLLLEILDLMLSQVCFEYKHTDDDFAKLNSLNCDSSNIEIYPKFECSWKHDNMYKTFRYHLNDFLKNLQYVDKNRFPLNFDTKHYVVNSNLFLKAKTRGFLRLGFSPLTNENVLDGMVKYSTNNGVNIFSVEGVNCEESVKTRCEEIFLQACEQDVDILMFPEMLGTENIKNVILGLVFNPGNNSPVITIFPSICMNNSNYSYISFSNSEIIQQFKNFKYLFSKDGENYQENLNFENKNLINLIHCDTFGTLVVAICKDLLIKDYVDFLIGDLGVSLIMSPSFSTGEYPFYITLPQGFQTDCNIVWVNSCAAQHVRSDIESFPDDIALVSEKGEIIKFNRSTNCENKCKGGCIFFHDMQLLK